MLSVVIPFLAAEAGLFESRCLELAGSGVEIIGVVPVKELGRVSSEVLSRLSELSRVKLLTSENRSRVAQINRGVKRAEGDIVAIVHVDTVVEASALLSASHLLDECARPSMAYFQLSFDAQAPLLCKVNAFLANQRSRILSIPFGDQVFVMRKSDFFTWGLMPDEYSSGEDHAFVQRLRMLGVPLLVMPQKVVSSSRRYSDKGWFSTTVRHVYLTLVQEWSRKGVRFER